MTQSEKILKMNRVLNEQKVLNEDVGVGSIVVGVLAALTIWHMTPIVVGGMAAVLSNAADRAAENAARAKRLAKDEEYAEAAKSIAERFKGDAHLMGLIKQLSSHDDSYPEKRKPILAKINSHVKKNLSSEEMKYLRAINAALRGDLD